MILTFFMFISFLFFAIKKEKKQNQRKEKRTLRNVRVSPETANLIDEQTHQSKRYLSESLLEHAPQGKECFFFFGDFLLFASI